MSGSSSPTSICINWSLRSDTLCSGTSARSSHSASVPIGREFEPVFAPQDLVNLLNYSVYLKLMIDGAPSKPFSATTLHPSKLR